jgi:hypothetical protein
MNGRLMRKTLGYSKEPEMLRATSVFRRCGLRPGSGVKELEARKLGNRQPAMAAGLTEHIWEIEEILTALPLPSTNT